MYFSKLFFIVAILIIRVTYSLTNEDVQKLKSYWVDRDKLTVSGLSSGAYFAVQFHVAFSSVIKGAGVIAGGPFWCAQDDVTIALSACMKDPSLISVKELIGITYNTAVTATIDHPSNLKDSRVYLFSGTQDTVVKQGVMEKLSEYYAHFIQDGNIFKDFSIPAEHSMVTSSYGNACDVLGSPYINNCNYSTAYHLLQQIYRDILPPNGSAAINGNLIQFDQSKFFLHLAKDVSMDSTGYLYVPNNCQNKQKECRLHIAFHGCKQGRMFVSDTYAQHAGYNPVAELNDIIILYPQAINSTLNPKGCWDWWGYTGSDYASKIGVQMAGIRLMMDRVSDFNSSKTEL